ncbi:hypothetical protein D3C78_1341360 [compost metagenome]
MTLFTISSELLPEYQPPSPIIPQYAAFFTLVSIVPNAAIFSACVFFLSKDVTLLKDEPKPTTAVLTLRPSGLILELFNNR